MSKQKHLMIAAAGTGGHVMPGLAVAQEMIARGWTVSWIGTTTGMESRLVASYDLEFDALEFTGMRGKGLGHMVKGALKLVKACFKSKDLIDARQADAVFDLFKASVKARIPERPPRLNEIFVGRLQEIHAEFLVQFVHQVEQFRAVFSIDVRNRVQPLAVFRQARRHTRQILHRRIIGKEFACRVL